MVPFKSNNKAFGVINNHNKDYKYKNMLPVLEAMAGF